MKAYVFNVDDQWSPYGSFVITAKTEEEATAKYFSHLSKAVRTLVDRDGYSVDEYEIDGLVLEAHGYDDVYITDVKKRE